MKIKTVSGLRENLLNELDLFYKSSKGESNIKRLNLISKTSSAIVKTAKLELEYAKFRRTVKDMPFLK